MKKRILALLLALVLTVSCLPPVALAEEVQTPENIQVEQPQKEPVQSQAEETAPVLSAAHGAHTCEHCADSSVTWLPWEKDNDLPTSGHYYLTQNVVLDATAFPNGKAIAGGELTLCLNGCSITTPTRAFRVSKGAKLTLSDCTGNGKIFAGASNGGAVALYKDASADAGSTLKMYNITIEGVTGKTPKQGGGVLVSDKGATVLLKNVDFKNLSIGGGTGGTTGGAAVYMTEGTASTGSLTMENCTVTGCTDSSPATAAGAVRCIQVGTVSFKNCSFTGNSAVGGTGAGAIMLSGGNVTMEGCTVTGNSCTTTSDWCGGIYVYSATQLTLKGKNIIEGNTINNGANEANLVLQESAANAADGNLHFADVDTSSVLNISARRGTTDPNLLMNVTSGGAFAITYETDGKQYRYDTVQAKFVLQEHVHTEGYAEAPAGAAWEPWTKTDSLPTSGYYYLTENVTLSSNVVLNTPGAHLYLCLNEKTITSSGRIFRVSNGHDLTVCDHTGKGILKADASNGGAIALVTDTNDPGYCDLNVCDITIEGVAGKTPKQGGGITCTNPHNNATLKNVTFKNLTIAGGTAENAMGGSAIFFYTPNSDGKLLMEGCTVTGCTDNSTSVSGAVRVWQAASAVLKNCTFTNNTNTGVGGSAVILSGAKEAVMEGCTVTGNTSTGTTEWAGAVYVFASSDLTLVGKNDISGNIIKNGAEAADLVLVENASGTTPVFLHFSNTDTSVTQNITAKRGTADPNALIDVTAGDAVFNINYGGDIYYYDTVQDKFVLGHKHDDDYAGVDGSVEWKPWNETDSLPVSGYYYLTEDVSIADVRYAEIKNDDLYLCLNGKTVTARAAGNDGVTNIFRLTGSGSLTVCDCGAHTENGVYSAGKLTGASMGAIFTMATATGTVNIYDGIFENNTTNDSGAVAVMQSTTKLYIYGGEFKNNTATNNGGAIFVGGSSSAVVSGGTFTGNHAPKNGGAIYVITKLDLQGGTFTGNTAGSVTGNNGAGIFFSGTELKLSGSPEITGNTVNGKANNLYLATGKVITLGEMGTGTAKIGISVAANTIPRFVSNDMGSTDCTAYFFSDNTQYEIIKQDNKLYLQTIYKHIHNDDYAGVAGDVVWKAWNSDNSLPTTEGYWYLTKNVTLDSRFAEIKTDAVYVCLNGFTVTAKAKGSDGLGTNIWRLTGAGKLVVCDCSAHTENGTYTAGMLTGTSMGAIYTMNNVGTLIEIYDGVFSGNLADGTNSGAAVVIQGGSRLNIHGGQYSNNEAGKSGGAIYNAGITYIYGGTFTGNTAATEGGAVYNTGNLFVLGGTFTGNEAGTLGGGIFTSGNVLGISGTPEIKGNTVNGAEHNLYLATGKVITLGTMGEGTAKIGISVAANTLPRFVSTEMGEKDCSGYFFSDMANVGLTVKENKLYMGMTTDHKHCDCFGIGGEHCDHTSRDWFKWTDATSLPTSGSWCLDTDVTVASTDGITVTGDLQLCLNGHSIDGDGHVILKIRNAEHDVLITDCKDKGEITNGSAMNYGAIYLEKGTFTMFGGKLTNNHCTQTASGGWAGGAIQARGDVLLVGVQVLNNISDTEGGAICMREAAKATLVNCTFKNNKAYTGGAIYAADGRNEITVKNCIFEGNSATTDGGAIVVKGKLTVEEGSVFEKNTADNCAGAVLVMSGGHFQMNGGKFTKNEAPKNNGGAIYISTGCTMTMDGGEVVENSAKISGGGIYLLSSSFTMNGGKISGNSVKYYGGAIASEGAEMTLNGGNIYENNADIQGGAIYAKNRVLNQTETYSKIYLHGVKITDNTSTDGAGIATIRHTEINMTDGHIWGNKASANAGGVLLQTGSKMTISGTSLVAKNEAVKSGGGIYVSSESTLTMDAGGKITENIAGTTGGGVMLLGTTFTMNDGTVYGNQASSGGGVYAKNNADVGAKFICKGGNFSTNTATSDGGGVSVYGPNTEFILDGGYLQKNSAPSGGGVLAVVESKVTVKDGSIVNNTSKNSGGGVFMSYTTEISISGGYISKNEAGSNGGGVYMLGSKLTITGGKISENQAKTQGGGIFATYKEMDKKTTYKSEINIRGGNINGNKTADGAGIATTRYTKINMTGGTVSNNKASKSAGGILIQKYSVLNLSGGTVSGNQAKYGGGGIFASSESTFNMNGGTVSGNFAEGDGAGVHLMYSTGNFNAGTIQNNKATKSNAGGIFVRGSKATMNGTDVLDNFAKKNGGGIVIVRYVSEKEGIDAQPELIINDGRIAGNRSDGPAGGMLLQSQAETKMTGGVIENNNSKNHGGGVYVSMNHTFTVTGGKITGNTCNGWGAGVYHLRGSVGNYQDCEISYNKTPSIGGGMIINGTEAQPSAVTMKNVLVLGNEAKEGGGVRTQDRFQTFQAEGCTFKENKATAIAGGLMLFFGLENARVKNCLFENNTADTNGAGVYVMSAMVDCQITGCTFKGNTAGSEGGGMWTQGGILVKDCVFDDNHAQQAGGGIATDVFANTRVRHPVLYVEDCIISNNTSGVNGGGIYADTASYISVSDTEITGNSSKAEGGGMWIVDDSTLHNVTVTGNRSGGEGYALYYHASEYDGLSYIRGAHKIGGEMIVKDNQGGDMYMGEQTGIAISEKGLTGETYMAIRLHSGYLTQLLRGAYNYEGGDTLYTVTAGNRSLTEPEVFAVAQDAQTENGKEGTAEIAVTPAVWIGGGALAVAIIAIVVLVLLLRKKKTEKK